MLFTQNDREEESVSNQVTLMTLHSAKGLEFPYVFPGWQRVSSQTNEVLMKVVKKRNDDSVM